MQGRIRALYTDGKYRARHRGIPFTIALDDLPIPATCPLLGIAISLTGGRDSSPSIDRIDPREGYVPGNVWIVCWRANHLKNNATLDEFKRIAHNWKRRLGKRKK